MEFINTETISLRIGVTTSLSFIASFRQRKCKTGATVNSLAFPDGLISDSSL